MTLIDRVREILPPKYRELAKFLVVGGTSYIVDVGVWFTLAHTVLTEKPIIAKAIGILVATVVSYVLNREWSFSGRGGRERHHEAMLFFLFNGLALLINLIPLAVSRYVIGIAVPEYTQFTVTLADFVAGSVIGTAMGMVFRFWAYRKWVFPEELAPIGEAAPPATDPEDTGLHSAR